MSASHAILRPALRAATGDRILEKRTALTALPPPSPGSGRRTVLVFHRVVAGALERDHDVRRSDFGALLDRLVAGGCTFTVDLAAAPTDGSVVLTFDDASTDHRAAADALTERGLQAVFFPTVAAIGTPGHLGADALRHLVAGGHVIGSHGWSHQRLDRLSDGHLEREIVTSRDKLEDLLGIGVTIFAPAGGIGFRALAKRLEAAGYACSRSMRWGIHRRVEDRWAIPAVPVTSLTVSRGWVDVAAIERRLPTSMTALGAVRNTLRPDVRTTLRGRILRRGRGAGVSQDVDD